MPKDDVNYRFTDPTDGLVYDFYDVFVPAELFRQPALWVWGLNDNGQLGISDTTNRTTPVTTFAGGSNWKQVAGHENHTAAIKTDGSLWTWGQAANGKLGDNQDTTNKSTPITTFAGGNDWKQISCGKNYTAAIKTDGSLWTWGLGGSGQLGDNQDTTNKLTPITTFAGGYDWKQVSCGDNHTVAIKTDGSLWTWGFNGSGELGIGDTTNRPTPITTFVGGNDWKQVSCGRQHNTAIKIDGSLWTWGAASAGRLGDNQDTTNKLTPITTFAGGYDWKQVDGGGGFTAAIKIDGSLWTWGYNISGQLGIDDTTNRPTPITTFAGGNDWKQVFALRAHTAAIKTNGSLWTWGFNGSGQLGIDDTTNRATPVLIFNQVNDWKRVGGEWDHTIAIRYQSDFSS